MTTEVVNGNNEDCDVWIDRRSRFGNPFKIEDFTDEMGREEARRLVVRLYEVYFEYRIERDDDFREAVEELKDKKLGCHCAPKLCHGDVIKGYLDTRV